MNKSLPNSIYGPVESWRLGRSLGVDMLCVDSICSFECVYCQLGNINQVTVDRDVFVSTEKVLDDLRNSDWQNSDVITFSGSGEPTLAANLGEVIEKIKEFSGKPIAVLTNSTLLHLKEVRDDLAKADKVFCKLDAWTDDVLRRVDRPHDGITLKSIISGIRALRDEFDGFLAIQTMLLREPKRFELKRFSEILHCLEPDEVQLNVPSRPVPAGYFLETRGNLVEAGEDATKLKTISKSDLAAIRQMLAEHSRVPIVIR